MATFSVRVTAPPSTPRSDMVCRSLTLPRGVITDIYVLIPPGHMGLAHLVIKHGETQIVPWNPDGDICGDDVVYHLRPYYTLRTHEEIRICAWNDDDTFEHTFYVVINVVPISVAYFARLVARMLARLLKVMGVT